MSASVGCLEFTLKYTMGDAIGEGRKKATPSVANHWNETRRRRFTYIRFTVDNPKSKIVSQESDSPKGTTTRMKTVNSEQFFTTHC